MRWFMDQVTDEIRTSRVWMLLGPELVEVIHRVRHLARSTATGSMS
jgi:hypothetical protein